MAIWNESYRLQNEADILTPALLCYEDVICRNIARMVEMAGDARRLWPHVKTHKSADVVRMMMRFGITSFKCATLGEAEMLGRCGAQRVLLAYPLVGAAIRRFAEIIASYPNTEFLAVFDDLHQLRQLGRCMQEKAAQIRVLVDVDSGLGRTGVAIDRLYDVCCEAARVEGVQFCGMHVYDGHRHESDAAHRLQMVRKDTQPVYACQQRLLEAGVDCSLMVMGGTPTFPCHAQDARASLSPGTCVLGDAGYAAQFADLPFEIGALLLCRVVSHPAPGAFTVDLGYKAVAADPAEPRAMLLGYEQAQTVMRNEEHWVLRMPEGMEEQRPAIGTTLYAAPWHICPTVLLHGRMMACSRGSITGQWDICPRF